MEKILIIEDVQALRRELADGLSDQYIVMQGADGAQAMELFLSHAPKVVTLDLGLCRGTEVGSDGFRFIEWVLESRPETKIVVLVERGDRETAYRAIGCGAYDFCHKPVELPGLKIMIRRAFHLSDIEEQRCRLLEALELSSAGMEGIAGQCAAMRQLFAAIKRAAPCDMAGGHAAHSCGKVEQGGYNRVNLGPGAAHNGWGEGGVHTDAALPAGSLTLREARDRVERGMISAAIDNCRGNIAKASEFLGVSRPALYDLMKKHGLVVKHGSAQ